LNKEDKDMKVPCEVYSRVVGFFAPVGKWNKGKKAEWMNRMPFETYDGAGFACAPDEKHCNAGFVDNVEDEGEKAVKDLEYFYYGVPGCHRCTQLTAKLKEIGVAPIPLTLSAFMNKCKEYGANITGDELPLLLCVGTDRFMFSQGDAALETVESLKSLT